MAQISKQALIVENNQSFPNNNNGAITPSDLRAYNVDVIDSTVNQTEYTANSASWNQQIDALEAFTASQQPSFNALNSFTASTSQSLYSLNWFTQSANAELDSLSAWTGSWEAWTSSINEIRDGGIFQGYSTRFFFGGLVSASIVQNVGGPIASIVIEQDGTKLNTSSFNDYTASTAATQSVFSASVATSISQSSAGFTTFSSSQNSFNQSATASLVELLNFSSSLDAGFVSEVEFGQFTQSINSFTSSIFGLGFATTGSNTFIGNQTITGSTSITGALSITPVIAPNSAPGGIGQFIIPFLSGSNNVFARDQDNALYWQPAFNILAVSASTGNTTMGVSGISVNSSTTGSTSLASTRITSNFGAGRNIAIAGDAAGTALSGLTGITNPSIILQSGSVGFPLQYYAPIQFQSSQSFTDGRVTITRRLVAQQNVEITGSVYGNIVPLSITSETASMNLSLGNFFTLTLVSGSTTHLSASNIGPGQTINLLVTQPSVGTGSVSYNSTFKFPAGANYVPTSISNSEDIVTFISYDTTKLYASSINNLI